MEQSLDEAWDLCAGSPGPGLPETRWRVARAALHLAWAEPELAVQVIQPVTDSAEVSADRCSALMLRSEALRALERHDASTAALLSARQLARLLGDVQTLARIALMLCDDAVSRGRFDEACDWARTAANDGPTGELLGRIEIARAALMLRLGCPATAALLADVSRQGGPVGRVRGPARRSAAGSRSSLGGHAAVHAGAGGDKPAA
ncbi:MAG: hypothetical protein ACRD0K_05215 [Egibacteraceae bacterium]